MMFLIRAFASIGLVAFFMPGDPAADALTHQARAAAQMAVDTAGDGTFEAVAEVCFDSPDLCTAGVNAIDDAQGLAVQGLESLAAALAEDDSAAN